MKCSELLRLLKKSVLEGNLSKGVEYKNEARFYFRYHHFSESW
jgi:hypothetical protein